MGKTALSLDPSSLGRRTPPPQTLPPWGALTLAALSGNNFFAVFASFYGCVLVTTSAAKPWRPLQEPEACIHGWMALTLTKISVQIFLYCLKCAKFGKLILRRIIKIVATRCHVLRLKCTKFDFVWGSVTDPTGELEGPT